MPLRSKWQFVLDSILAYSACNSLQVGNSFDFGFFGWISLGNGAKHQLTLQVPKVVDLAWSCQVRFPSHFSSLPWQSLTLLIQHCCHRGLSGADMCRHWLHWWVSLLKDPSLIWAHYLLVERLDNDPPGSNQNSNAAKFYDLPYFHIFAPSGNSSNSSNLQNGTVKDPSKNIQKHRQILNDNARASSCHIISLHSSHQDSFHLRSEGEILCQAVKKLCSCYATKSFSAIFLISW